MSDFDPGEGWKRGVTGTGEPGVEYIEHVNPDGTYTRYFREEPLPPLPTEPYTVIRVTWRGDHAEETGVRILVGPVWVSVTGYNGYSPRELVERITGFEVLAEPRGALDLVLTPAQQAEFHERVRRETAEAVLDRLGILVSRHGYTDAVDLLNREFGVDS